VRAVATALMLSGGLAWPGVASAGDARCEVWARELAFAASVAARDAAAFAGYVHPQAVFAVTRPQPLRGSDAIVTAWRGVIDGTAVRLWWYPDRVNAGGEGLVASSGPALYQDPATGAYRTGRFSSVWQRDAQGTWRVVFDDGSEPVPADAAQVEAFHAGRREACPPA